MSVVPFKPGQKVAKAFAHLDPNKALGEGVAAGGFPIINYRGKIWSLQYQGNKHLFKRADDNSQLTYLDVIIVGHPKFIAKTYYPNQGEFDEDNTDRPTCKSINGIRPDADVAEPQSELCGTCKKGAWTTLPNGRQGKLCQDQKRMAVLLMPAMTKRMLGSPLKEPAYLKVPPGSLQALKAYGEQLQHDGYPFCSVVTRIGFDPKALFQFTFDIVHVLDDDEAPMVLPMLDDPRTLRIIGESPEIREVKPAIAKREKIETGLIEAFGEPAQIDAKVEPPVERDGAEPTPKKRGRPAKAKADPAQIDIEEAIAAKPLPKAEMKWEDSDDDLDSEISNLLDKKTSEMLK
jgi:hypothetical protein